MQMTRGDILLVSESDVEYILRDRLLDVLPIIKEALLLYHHHQAVAPTKIVQVFDEQTQNRINCLPATIIDRKICGVKWVSVFPTNATQGLANINACTILSSTEDGRPIAYVGSAFLTNLRTAAVGVLAASVLAVSQPTSLGLIGAGEIAKAHFKLLKQFYPTITDVRISSRTAKSEMAFLECFHKHYPDVRFSLCASDHEKAAEGADIIVTAISGQAPLLKARSIKKGAFYIHAGGYEDEYAVAQKADKIICDDWEAVKHRSQTISRMYAEALIDDKSIYANLPEILTGEKPGRENENEFIYFNSVGLACIDILLAHEIVLKAVRFGRGIGVPMG